MTQPQPQPRRTSPLSKTVTSDQPPNHNSGWERNPRPPVLQTEADEIIMGGSNVSKTGASKAHASIFKLIRDDKGSSSTVASSISFC